MTERAESKTAYRMVMTEEPLATAAEVAAMRVEVRQFKKYLDYLGIEPTQYVWGSWGSGGTVDDDLWERLRSEAKAEIEAEAA